MVVASPDEADARPIDQDAIAAALQAASLAGHFPSVLDSGCKGSAGPGPLWRKPLGLLYDLDVWDSTLETIAREFGPGCRHTLAVKGTAVGPMLRRAVEKGFGLECASLGEALHAQAVGCPAQLIVFDSPCKTRSELAYALKQGLHLNVDSLEELARLAQIRESLAAETPAGHKTGTVGLRLNPLCGAGEIADLSVSVSDSKFGVAGSEEAEILAAFKAHPWLCGLHVHVGSGAMGLPVLVEGVKACCDLAARINLHVGRRQVTVMDIGGGLHPDYRSDTCPPFAEYAALLRKAIPGLLPGEGEEALFDVVVTELGQALSAKTGFLASRLEYVKEVRSQGGKAQIAVGHFGADLCVRQCYTKDHKRRIEFYDAESCQPVKRARREAATVTTHLAGPLCFQGDFPARDLEAPPLHPGDFAVMREAGSNTLSLFSRHCSRFAPAVLGYRLKSGGTTPVVSSLEVLKPFETPAELCRFWGTEVSEDQLPDGS